ncbi:MAG: GntR family transcriptional regulator [Caulobacter sp.]|nr:GntR family transcriptional regulator [Caulobacter sp.]
MLRRRLVEHGPLQGAPLPVNAIAGELGVSQTPVREALARLAGEGMITHTRAGYAGVVHDAESLAGLYGLAGLLSLQLFRRVTGPVSAGTPLQALGVLREQVDNRVLAAEVTRVLNQLAPFAVAEAIALSAERWPVAAHELAAFFRRYYARRARRSGAIFTAALTASIRSRL